jgi:four helix bundle protein
MGEGRAVSDYRELRVYTTAFEAAMRIYHQTRRWPAEEKYALTDQVLRSSRSVCGRIAEGWQRRQSAEAFSAKLIEACELSEETCVWLEFAFRCGYLDSREHDELAEAARHVSRMLTRMVNSSGRWCRG